MLARLAQTAACPLRSTCATNRKALAHRQKLLKVVYDPSIQGIIALDTREMSAKEVAKEICRIIHMEEYGEFDFQARLDAIEKGGVKPPEPQSEAQPVKPPKTLTPRPAAPI